MKKIILAIGISLVVGFAAASWMETALVPKELEQSPDPAPPSFDTAAPVEERIRALEQAVVVEQQARQFLEEEIFILREQIEKRDAEPGDTEERSVAARQERREAFMNRRFGAASTQGQLDRLIQGGFPPDRAEWIVRREGELMMEQLQARYDAMRGNEGQASFGFGQGFSQANELRSELGDADYERYLAATGRPTSIGIGRVFANSPAEQAGVQPGDRIVRYDGERVFSMMDMANRIMQSPAEGNVVVDIERGGVQMQLVIPRGPLGVSGN